MSKKVQIFWELLGAEDDTWERAKTVSSMDMHYVFWTKEELLFSEEVDDPSWLVEKRMNVLFSFLTALTLTTYLEWNEKRKCLIIKINVFPLHFFLACALELCNNAIVMRSVRKFKKGPKQKKNRISENLLPNQYLPHFGVSMCFFLSKNWSRL